MDDGDPHVLRTRNEAETKAVVDHGWTTDDHGHHYCWDCGWLAKEWPLFKEPARPVELEP